MKKLLLAVAVLGLAAGLAATSVNAAEDTRGYVTVATSANTEVSPDVVEINISVKTKDSKSLQKATAENKEISDKVYNAIKGMIDTTKGDYVKTSDSTEIGFQFLRSPDSPGLKDFIEEYTNLNNQDPYGEYSVNLNNAVKFYDGNVCLSF